MNLEADKEAVFQAILAPITDLCARPSRLPCVRLLTPLAVFFVDAARCEVLTCAAQAGDDSDPFAEAELAEQRAAAAAARARPPAATAALFAAQQPGAAAPLALPAPATAPAPAPGPTLSPFPNRNLSQAFGGGMFGALAASAPAAAASAAVPALFGAGPAAAAPAGGGGLFGAAAPLQGQPLLARSQSMRKGKSKK